MWCVAELDEKYIECMEDVRHWKSRMTRTSRSFAWTRNRSRLRPPRPAAPGHTAKRDNEYQRCGTANVFAVVEPKAAGISPAQRRIDGGGIREDAGIPAGSLSFARTIHLVWDNLNIHCKNSLTGYYGEESGGEMWSRLTIHPTPIHGSWLNQAEIELSMYSRQCLGRRRMADLETLQQETSSWKDRVNRDQVKINWTFDRKAARKTFGYKKNSFRQSKT